MCDEGACRGADHELPVQEFHQFVHVARVQRHLVPFEGLGRQHVLCGAER